MTDTFVNPLLIPVFGICAYSGSGKTTLLCKLLPIFKQRGIRVAVIKHAHHNFDIDKPEKDSFLLRQAGAQQLLIASDKRYAHIYENAERQSPKLQYLLKRIDATSADLVLVEGFKHESFAKMEVHRHRVTSSLSQPFIHTNDEHVVAIACCQQTKLTKDIPRFDIDDINRICEFISDYVGLEKAQQSRSANCAELPSGSYDVNQATEHILAKTPVLMATESVALANSRKRVLSAPVYATIDVPQYTNSAMDGYAFSADAVQAKVSTGVTPEEQTRRLKLHLVGQVFAGQHYSQPLIGTQAVRIMTGAKMPAGSDTVIAKEFAQTEGEHIVIEHNVSKGQNVRQAGEDIAKNSQVFRSGKRLGAAEMGLLASLGHAQVDVYRSVRVAIFSTGDEVCAPGESLSTASIYDANRFTLTGLLQQLHCQIIDLGIINDDQNSLEQALSHAAQQADVVISSGGVSVGDADYIKASLERLGRVEFWRVAMRPGRPLAFGLLDTSDKPSHSPALFFGIPGNPVAAMICFMLFVQPAIRKLSGERDWQQPKQKAVATTSLRSRYGRDEYLRGYYDLNEHGQLQVTTTGPQGSGILSSMVAANCLIHIPVNQQHIEPGTLVDILPLID
ncbi:bifunctional molybdopterin-guanine dinucleotide biosynthesis adaptor protein MobB/molybdopterin molybdotransferase MoeA [Thalassotalea maritima]|uniref:bifunctional molybdopterin-guanine dinucleotide biosynthesis adaptor protein MobB/molybdopterin molybdotransferase MoeA n=1 Tax=Thalassotalea maritima TaxID=3242416 RepID=UPI00352821B2